MKAIDLNENRSPSGVDKTLVAMHLNMSVEDRLSANDDAARTIQELRNAFRRKKGGAEPHS